MTCPRCGAPFGDDDLAPVCLRCALSDTARVKAEGPSVSPPRIERPRRKLPGIWTLLAVAAIFSVFSSFRDRRPVSAPKRSLVLDKGIALYRQGKLAEAITEFRRVILSKPRLADAHYNLAVALAEQQNFEESIAEYRATIGLAHDHAGAHKNLGVILAGRGELEEAIEHYRKAIQIKADVGEFHKNLGNALEAQDKPAEAIAAYRNAVWYMPQNPSARFDLGNALEAQGKLDEAIAELRKARETAQPGSEIAQLIESTLMEADARETSRKGER
jgi:tetratricopeptide (TPR) repeat protein